ncbi:MAG TPA: FAD-dependent thymidylate synthase [Acidimicrobiales bacterium]
MTVYVAEEFSQEEADVLRRYFTNLDEPVFALVNLPEVVKGALFARYSRSPKSLRRLFLDEFVNELDISGDVTIDATVGLRRAEELYDRVFFEYGDDSVAQLGGVHLACEQASNLLTKVLEWGRLMAYLEQSTRYIAYDARIGGRYRFHRDPDVLMSSLGTRYVGDMDRLFDTYAEMLPRMGDFFRDRFPKDAADSDFVYRQAIRAKAFDALRGILPAASLSNVGIYGTGQGYEQLLLRMRAHPLPEARTYADLMLNELRKVIPSFLKRVDLEDRGVAWSAYLASGREAMDGVAERLFPATTPADPAPLVRLVDFDPDGEIKMVAAMLYSHLALPEDQIERRVRAMSVDDRLAVMRAYAGDRANRRHKPGRGLERSGYRFDVVADYGAFRDLQRHRMLTIEWQRLTPHLGYTRPEAVDAAGEAPSFDEAMERSAALYEAMEERFAAQASYAVALAYKVRFVMQMNAREAMHMLELRTTPQGHPAYRVVGQEMHRLIAEEAGHHAVAEMMRYVDHQPEPALERLDSERRAEARRQGG